MSFKKVSAVTVIVLSLSACGSSDSPYSSLINTNPAVTNLKPRAINSHIF